MKKEKIQIIFFYTTIVAVLALLGFLGYTIFDANKNWEEFKKDPNKKTFVENIEKLSAKKSDELTIDELISLGNDYGSLGLYDYAIKYYQKSLAKGENITAQLNMANAYVEKKDYKMAQDVYLESIERYSSNPEGYLKLAELYKKDWKGKKHDALYVLSKGNDAVSSFEIMMALANYYKESGEVVKSLEMMKKALKLNPDNEALKEEIKQLEG